MPGHYNKKKKVAKGEGGVPGEKWDDPSKKKGPFVPPPKRLAKKHVIPDVNV